MDYKAKVLAEIKQESDDKENMIKEIELLELKKLGDSMMNK